MCGDKWTTSYNLSSFELTAVLTVPGKDNSSRNQPASDHEFYNLIVQRTLL